MDHFVYIEIIHITWIIYFNEMTDVSYIPFRSVVVLHLLYVHISNREFCVKMQDFTCCVLKNEWIHFLRVPVRTYTSYTYNHPDQC